MAQLTRCEPVTDYRRCKVVLHLDGLIRLSRDLEQGFDRRAAVAKGTKVQSPLPRCAACIFRVGGRSINVDAGSSRLPRDFRDGGSDAHGSEAGRPEVEVEGTGVRFAVAC